MSHQEMDESALKIKKLQAELRELKVWSPVKAIVGVVTGLLTLGLTYCGFIAATGPLQERLKLEKKEIDLAQARINISIKQIGDALEAVFSEPSDLALTCHESGRGSPLLLVVDDEVHFPLLVEPSGGRLLAVGRIELGSSKRLDDIEIVASLPGGKTCADWKYLIATSHRESDEERATKVVVFGIEKVPGNAEQYESIQPVSFSLLEGMVAYLAGQRVFDIVPRSGNNKYTIDSQEWWTRKQDSDHEYALEIEAAAASDDDFWIGLKYPLKEGKAVVLRYSLDGLRNAKDRSPAPFGHSLLDLDNQGISAMTMWNGNMLVVSNPSNRRAYERSFLHAFVPSDNHWTALSAPIFIGQPKVKAEGIAVDAENNLWLSYDGERGALMSRKIVRSLLGNVALEADPEHDGQQER
jgi:hypothetical protein